MSQAIVIRYSNRTKVLLCYLLAFGIALIVPQAALRLLYPYKLAGSAPNVLAQLADAFPSMEPSVDARLDAMDLSADMTLEQRAAALSAQENVWIFFVSVWLAAGWTLTLFLQLLWRVLYQKPHGIAASITRAIRGYRRMSLVILLVNVLCAFPVAWFGVRWIPGVSFWDGLLYFGGFALHFAAAIVCFRLAAPPSLSGKGAFFRRL